MDTMKFRKYVEDMNRQSLDKKLGHRDSSVLLPHQRMRLAHGPKRTSSGINGDGSEFVAFSQNPVQGPLDALLSTDVTLDRNVPREHSKQLDVYSSGTSTLDIQSKSLQLQLNTDFPQRQDLAPTQQGQQHESLRKASVIGTPSKINNGLAKSRWANPSYTSSPRHSLGQPPGASLASGWHEEQSVVKKRAVNPAEKVTDNYVFWKSDEKYGKSIANEATTTKLESNVSTGQSSNARVSAPEEYKKPDETEPTGWDYPGPASSQTANHGDNRSTIDTLAQASGEETRGTEKYSVSSRAAVVDPRANWPTETGIIHKVNHSSGRQSQDRDPWSRKPSSDTASISTEGEKTVPRYVSDFIDTWRQGAHSMVASFLSQGNGTHEDCDVDTYEGVLMEPVEYLKTKKHELMSRDQLEMTSAFAMRQYMAEMERKDPQKKAQRKAEKQARAAAKAATAVAEQENVAEPLPNPNEVQTPCHLRPATESDMAAITAIYNQEIVDGHTVMDTKLVGENCFRRIYDQSLAEKMPFIVAVEGWYGTISTTPQRVIGFSLVTAVSRGIAGSYDTLSRRGGKLLVIVRPEFRRRKVGTALIDIIVTNCTGWHISKGGYQFVNFTHDWISTEFGRSPRKWWYLELDVMIRSAESEEKARNGEEFQWIWNFLEGTFNLFLQHYDEKCFYQDQKMQWLDKLTFRRDCRTRGE